MNIETTSATASDITPSVDYDTLASGLTYSYADTFIMEDTEYRKLYLLEDVDDTIFEKINYFILRYNEMDDENKTPIKKRVPIKLYINSYGGSVYDGFGCIETIRASKTPVYGICFGYAMSMAFHIFANCHKRFATRSAILLNHEGVDGMCTHPSKLRDYMEFSNKMNGRLNQYLCERTSLTMEQLCEDERIESYMFADEAKEKGLVDVIVNNISDIK